MSDMSLAEWMVAFSKYKDSVTRKIDKLEINGNVIVASLKNGSSEKYLCSESLASVDFSKLDYAKVACLNTKANVDKLIEGWDHVKDRKVVFIFVNIKRAESWSINPQMHHRITDRPALKLGLMTLFQSVPEAS